ncbi:MAG: ATP-binding cassette domain-containing protein, partial [Candidatus Methanomethylicaceae archaeon]
IYASLLGDYAYYVSNVVNPVDTFYAIWVLERFGIEYNRTGAQAYSITISLLPAPIYEGYPEREFYSVYAAMLTGYSYSDFEKNTIATNLMVYCYNSSTGGFKSSSANVSGDVLSTYYAVSLLDEFNDTLLWPPLPDIADDVSQFLSSLQKDDGSFGLTLDTPSSISSTVHAILTEIILASYKASGLNETLVSLAFNWLEKHRAKNGLFGDFLLEYQLFGVSVAFKEYDGYLINRTRIIEYVRSCKNPDGGYSSLPHSENGSNLVSTYAAIKTLEYLEALGDETDTANWVRSKQNISTGAFVSRISFEMIFPLPGPYSSPIVVETESLEASYFAYATLRALNQTSYNDTALLHWVLSDQNLDGSFGAIIGLRGELISTFIGIELLEMLNASKPLSVQSAMEFIISCEKDDGSFKIHPLINTDYIYPTLFATYSLAKMNVPHKDATKTIEWLLSCREENGGFGDSPGFGADPRHSYIAIKAFEDIRIEHGYDTASWRIAGVVALITEALVLGLLGLYSLAQYVLIKTLRVLFPEEKKDYMQYPAVMVDKLKVKAGKKTIISNVSFSIEHGEILGIIGESGAGKTTTIKALLGTVKSTGDIKIYGLSIRKRRDRRKMRALYGYVPQELSRMYEEMTVMENIYNFGRQYNLTAKEIESRAMKILEDLEIADKADTKVANLSGGQKRRASIAIAMVHSPLLLILDEPTSGLDPVMRTHLWNTLLKINEKGTSLIVVTHYPEESAYCDKVAIFLRGEGLIDFGNPKELLSTLPGNGRVVVLKMKKRDPKITLVLDQNRLLYLEDREGEEYRIFADINIPQLEKMLEGFDYELNVSGATMNDYFRIKALMAGRRR